MSLAKSLARRARDDGRLPEVLADVQRDLAASTDPNEREALLRLRACLFREAGVTLQ